MENKTKDKTQPKINEEKHDHPPGIGDETRMLDFGNLRISEDAFDYIIDNMERRRKIGPFYYYKDKIHAPLCYRKEVDIETPTRGLLEIDSGAGEHRTLWERHMTIFYPELKVDYFDNHEALPRGRVDFHVKNGQLAFRVTLDKCIENQESEIKRIFNIAEYDVEFHYGATSYQNI